MLEGVGVNLNEDFLSNKAKYLELADKIIYTGPIDEFYGNNLGKLEYRSLEFKTDIIETSNYQGNAVINYKGISVLQE